ncbi:hypothetical protein [Rubellimicrobium rubrum]|uniref:hypothetical protein n=1 Tax=Rubellimicrobium rubrum TaxID=2585369 RepID=UPI001FEBC1FB|nr:hypothetical protein [Rubellimicrobium rubrum]
MDGIPLSGPVAEAPATAAVLDEGLRLAIPLRTACHRVEPSRRSAEDSARPASRSDGSAGEGEETGSGRGNGSAADGSSLGRGWVEPGSREGGSLDADISGSTVA